MKVLRVLVTTTALLAAGAAMADEAVVHDSYAFDKNQLIPVGAYYTGNPTVKLVSSGSAVTTGDQSLEEAVNAEARKIANDDKYKWLPVGKVGVNFFW
ncbi:hypothetical protein L1W81_00485 [Acinetobacter baumannii]|nr:hypothetical protein [Acinetobacter baumannii]MCF4604592.1 hypothetical protein [Acinetobacter baumannii]